MQHVTAFSSPQTVPAVPGAAPKRTLWILDSWRDLILYVGTPLLLLPLFALAQTRWSAQDIYLFISAFGALGHHLPGMIRAYGDRALFERFRWRFILAPIFLAATCVMFYYWDLKGIILIVFFWGVWHGMMQTYGFCRIYDAKMGSFAALTRRLDFATCGIWFATAVALSPARLGSTLDVFYASGGPFISPSLVRGMQQFMLAAAVAVSVGFLTNYSWMWARGKRPNPIKLALLLTTISFWWYCNNGVTNILAGIALFEVFHDVQYLSLVWIYNRNRVEKDRNIGGFMRFVFRRSGSLIGLYVGLVLAYGSFGYLSELVGVDTLKRALMGIVAASGLLHFYYDGFIWKVRERSTRESLGIGGSNVDISASGLSGLFPSWALHGAKWVAIFVIPLTAFWFWQTRGIPPDHVRQGWIVADLPTGGASPHFHYAEALAKAGRADEAEKEYHIAIGLDPKDAKTHHQLGTLLLAQNKIEPAARQFEETIRIQPGNGEAHYDHAYAMQRLGRKAESGVEYELGARLSPQSERTHNGFGAFLESEGKLDEAIGQYRQAVQCKPNSVSARYHLGKALLSKGDLSEAKMHLAEVAKIDKNHADARNLLGQIHFRQGELSQAIVQYNEALRLRPDFAEAEENLRVAKASEGRFSSQAPK